MFDARVLKHMFYCFIPSMVQSPSITGHAAPALIADVGHDTSVLGQLVADVTDFGSCNC